MVAWPRTGSGLRIYGDGSTHRPDRLVCRLFGHKNESRTIGSKPLPAIDGQPDTQVIFTGPVCVRCGWGGDFGAVEAAYDYSLEDAYK